MTILNTDQSFIARAREQIFGAQRRRAVERRHEKIEREKESAEVELFLDTCKAEGLDENNPRDLAIMLRAWCLKKGEPLQDEDTDWDQSGGPFLD
jgi:hypothetical protein